MPDQAPLSISTIERETGLSKDVLRKWESRYGFPAPSRDANGDRLYPAEQLVRLRLIKRLLDSGHRPAEIVPQSATTLARMSADHPGCEIPPAVAKLGTEIVDMLRSHNPGQLHQTLRSQLLRYGLEIFVLDIMPALACIVGDAWAQGRIQVFDEHLFTEVLQGVVRNALGDIATEGGSPVLLLTTAPGELHLLGLLMAQAILTLQGARCISLGSQTPIADIAEAANAYAVDIVGLSFSTAYNPRQISQTLAALRHRLPARIDLWAGGGGVARLDRLPAGVRSLPTLQEAVARLAAFGGPSA